MEIYWQTANWQDFLALTKPRVVLLHLLTASASMILAAGGLPQLSILTAVLAGGGLVAGASNALNCYFDRDIDRIMMRTRNRPLPSGRLNPLQAITFSGIIGFAGLYILSRFVSWQAAILAVGALAYYILVYTVWLKRRTYWSSIIGSGAGAFPPLIGWIAITGQVETIPFLLFLIIVLWTLPHYWSLAITRHRDYETAGLGVIPILYSTRWISGFSFLLILVSLLIRFVCNLGLLYLVTASVLGLILIILVVNLNLNEGHKTARRLFWYSIAYLVILFGAMMVDKLV